MDLVAGNTNIVIGISKDWLPTISDSPTSQSNRGSHSLEVQNPNTVSQSTYIIRSI